MNINESDGNPETPRKINLDQIQILGEGEHSSHPDPESSAPNARMRGNPAFGKSVVWVSKGGPVAWIFGLALLPLFLFIGLFILSIFMIFQFVRIFSSKR